MSTMYCGDNCNHTGPHRYPPTVSDLVWQMNHVHDWRYVTTLADGQVLVLCSHHEPPETRRLQP